MHSLVFETLTFYDNPGLLIIKHGSETEAPIVDIGNGQIEIDTRTRVSMPIATADEPAAYKSVYLQLSNAEYTDYCDEIGLLFDFTNINKQDFAEFCQLNGFPLSRFWFRKPASFSSSAAKAQCARWLKNEMRKSGKPSSKSKMRNRAIEDIPGLSIRMFDEVWKNLAPLDWRLPGAPRRKDGQPS